MYSCEPSPRMGDGENTAIVDWTSSDPTPLAYPRRLIWRRLCLFTVEPEFCEPYWLALLPDDLNSCFSISGTLCSHSYLAKSARLWANAISPPYHVYDSIRFSVLTDEGVKGHASSMIDRVDLLSYSSFCSSAQMGYDRTMLCCFPEPNMLAKGKFICRRLSRKNYPDTMLGNSI